jgi:acyl-coenzyme A thioesterase PaaI-like protein
MSNRGTNTTVLGKNSKTATCRAATDKQATRRLASLRARDHAYCMICGPGNPFGLQLAFRAYDDGAVEASFLCGEAYQGYDGIVHGGMLASLLDGAMANCLFAHGISGVTGHFNMRILHPVTTDRPILVRAWPVETRGRMHTLKGELLQDGRTMVRGTAKFMALVADDHVPPPSRSVFGETRKC